MHETNTSSVAWFTIDCIALPIVCIYSDTEKRTRAAAGCSYNGSVKPSVCFMFRIETYISSPPPAVPAAAVQPRVRLEHILETISSTVKLESIMQSATMGCLPRAALAYDEPKRWIRNYPQLCGGASKNENRRTHAWGEDLCSASL